MKKLLLLSLLVCGISYGMDEKEQEWLKIGKARQAQEAEVLAVQQEQLQFQKEQADDVLELQREQLEVERGKLAVEEARFALELLQFSVAHKDYQNSLADCCLCGACSLNETDAFPFVNFQCAECGQKYMERPSLVLKKEARKRLLNFTFRTK